MADKMADIAVLPTSRDEGITFEQVHVQKVYDEIAASVNDIQHKTWPHVRRFLKKLDPGSIVADIGCGNGRYLDINKMTYKLGLDVCCPLVDYSRSKGNEVAYGDNLYIPLRDNTCDGVVSIGVIHHFSSHERRVHALKELCRILRPGGKLMLYVWAYEQKRRKFDSQDVLVPWNFDSKDITRPGSISSRHSSFSGMSSTSSISEDDSTDIPTFQSKHSASHVLQRQSSGSLDDLSSLSDLSYFKPNYYSLDFNGSHIQGKGKDRKKDSDNSYNEKITLAKECQKFQASLRAMSTGNLEELKEKSILEDLNKQEDEKNDSLHYSLEHINRKKKMFTSRNPPLNALRLKTNSHFQNIEHGKENVDSQNCQKDVKIRQENNSGNSSPRINQCEKIVQDKNSSGNSSPRINAKKLDNLKRCQKINPFLKQDSLDPYTFNDVVHLNTDDDCESLEDVVEVTNETDEVFVGFKSGQLDITTETEKKGQVSFFHSLKSKLSKIFDENSAKDKTKRVQDFNDNNCSKREIEKIQFRQMASKSCDLTPELLDIAAKHNFKVREFPQSSCPDIMSQVSDTKLKIKLDQKEITDNAKTEQKFSNQQEPENAQWKNRQDCLSKNGHGHMYEKSQSHGDLHGCVCCTKGHEKLDVIYDGYIKINCDTAEEPKDKENTVHKNKCVFEISSEYDTPVDTPGRQDEFCGYIWDDVTVTDEIEEEFNKLGTDLTIRDGGADYIVEDKFDKKQGKHLLCREKNKENKIHETQFEKGLDVNNEAETNTCDLDDTCFYPDNTCSTITNVDTSFDNDVTVQRGITLHDKTDALSTIEDNFSSKFCRYYHVFREGELELMISGHIPDLQIKQCFYDHANWCVVAEKK